MDTGTHNNNLNVTSHEGLVKCGRCKQYLPPSHFHPSRKSSTGFQSYCKDCAREYKRNYRKHNTTETKHEPSPRTQPHTNHDLTLDQIAYIIANYRQKTETDMALDLSITRNKVKHGIEYLVEKNVISFWSDDELKTLNSNYETTDLETLAKQLNYSPKVTFSKIQSIKIKKSVHKPKEITISEDTINTKIITEIKESLKAIATILPCIRQAVEAKGLNFNEIIEDAETIQANKD